MVVSAAVDMLNLISEFNSSILRDHSLQTKDTVSEVRAFIGFSKNAITQYEYTHEHTCTLTDGLFTGQSIDEYYY